MLPGRSAWGREEGHLVTVTWQVRPIKQPASKPGQRLPLAAAGSDNSSSTGMGH